MCANTQLLILIVVPHVAEQGVEESIGNKLEKSSKVATTVRYGLEDVQPVIPVEGHAVNLICLKTVGLAGFGTHHTLTVIPLTGNDSPVLGHAVVL